MDIPIMLNVRGRRCLVIGAGKVGRRRARMLSEAGAKVAVVDPRLPVELADEGIECQQRRFEPSDLHGAFLVVCATDDPVVNGKAGELAGELGILVNRADLPGEGDVQVLAHQTVGPFTVCVHSGGAGAPLAARLGRELAASVDSRLLEYAQHIQRMREEAARLNQPIDLVFLASQVALDTFRQGGAEALERAHRDQLHPHGDQGAQAPG
ncbi:MAG: bifunctional precorrin-2 dehydrogenase/sirohydrochlorin ferrochelatase [Phycisphaeraceae bacterium]|nr:bifunctional precorrin-2 dehydrogenase/sirohydrochlorin ferrochelatase [Phycisphaeraceae bacterium]